MTTIHQIRQALMAFPTKSVATFIVLIILFCGQTQAQDKEKIPGILCKQDNTMLGRLRHGEPVVKFNDDEAATGYSKMEKRTKNTQSRVKRKKERV